MPVSNGDNEYRAQPDDTNIPVPDPSRLTTQLVDRALGAFREVIQTRLEGMDRATELIATALEKFQHIKVAEHEHLRDDMDRQRAASREFILSRVEMVDGVSSEKFKAIAGQFAERDTRTEQAAQESRISLDAALAAAKEAVSEQNKANALAIGKSEDATKERLDALALLMSTSNKSLEDKIITAMQEITTLRSRVDVGPPSLSTLQTRADESTGRNAGALDARTLLFAVIGAGLGIAGLALAFLR